MAKPKKRRLKRRKNVKPSERTPATPETLAKLQRDGLQDMLARDPEEGGIGAHAVETLLEIEATFAIIERETGAGNSWLSERSDGGGSHEISDGAARLWAIWNIWATELFRRTRPRGVTGVWVAGVVRAREPVERGAVVLLKTAASLWDTVRKDYDDERRAKTRHTIVGCRS